jgi:hypothetical protein
MKISTAKKRVVQAIAGQFSCIAVLYKCGKAPSAACALCGNHAETHNHILCFCPALKEARIRDHPTNNFAQRLWKGIKDACKGWAIVTELMVAGLLGLPHWQPEDQMGEWQRVAGLG